MARKPKSVLNKAMSLDSNGFATKTEASDNLLKNQIATKELATSEDENLTTTTKETAKLTQEKDLLLDSVAGYLEQIDELKSQNVILQRNYDQSLKDISDLTFEITKLKIQLSQLEQEKQDNSKHPTIYNSSTNVSYIQQVPTYKMNGYGNDTWN